MYGELIKAGNIDGYNNYHITAACRCRISLVNRNIKLNFNSQTPDGFDLILTCENEVSNTNATDKQVFHMSCHINGSWIPNLADFIKSCSILQLYR